MADNPIKNLMKEMAVAPEKRPMKSNHTLYIKTTQFKAFRDHCESIGQKPSEVVDRLIELWLKEAGIAVPEDEEPAA